MRMQPCTPPNGRGRTAACEPVHRPRRSPPPSRLFVMGLLEDAIREHLDLKRRRGADPEDVERAEHEALGPARRDPFENGDGGPEAAVVDEPPYDEALE